MNSLRSGLWHGVNRAAAALLLLAALPLARAQVLPSSSGFRDVSLAEYRQHLEQLDGVVANCAAQLQLKTPAPNENACDPNLIGPDDRVHGAGSEAREVRYHWLRSALSRAENKTNGAISFALGAKTHLKKDQPDINALLNDAHERLRIDEQQVDSPLAANLPYAAQRKSLNTILAQREYKGVTEVTAKDRMVEWIENLLDHILSAVEGFGERAPWIGRLLELLIVAAVLTILIWLLVRRERNARVRLVPDIETAPVAPSAREWQLWLKDAQTAAAAGAWRDAIHSVYWAAISQLESNVGSSRPWPVDRARTPREYLGLLRGTDPRKPALTALTRSFERTWYGGREAAAADFNAALHLAAELGVEAK